MKRILWRLSRPPSPARPARPSRSRPTTTSPSTSHQYKTFSWHDTGDIKDSLWEKRIENVLSDTLAAKGLKKVDTGGDVWLVVHARLSKQTQINTYNSGWGYGYGWYGGGMQTSTVSEIPVGTLVVDLVDGKKKDMVWRGIASDTLIRRRHRRTARRSCGTSRRRCSRTTRRRSRSARGAGELRHEVADRGVLRPGFRQAFRPHERARGVVLLQRRREERREDLRVARVRGERLLKERLRFGASARRLEGDARRTRSGPSRASASPRARAPGRPRATASAGPGGGPANDEDRRTRE